MWPVPALALPRLRLAVPCSARGGRRGTAAGDPNRCVCTPEPSPCRGGRVCRHRGSRRVVRYLRTHELLGSSGWPRPKGRRRASRRRFGLAAFVPVGRVSAISRVWWYLESRAGRRRVGRRGIAGRWSFEARRCCATGRLRMAYDGRNRGGTGQDEGLFCASKWSCGCHRSLVLVAFDVGGLV